MACVATWKLQLEYTSDSRTRYLQNIWQTPADNLRCLKCLLVELPLETSFCAVWAACWDWHSRGLKIRSPPETWRQTPYGRTTAQRGARLAGYGPAVHSFVCNPARYECELQRAEPIFRKKLLSLRRPSDFLVCYGTTSFVAPFTKFRYWSLF